VASPLRQAQELSRYPVPEVPYDQLTSNVNFQDNLLNALLMRTLLWEMAK